MWVVLPILLFLAALALKLRQDFNDWKDGIPTDHDKEFMFYAPVVCITAGVLFCALSNSLWSILVVPFMLGIWWNTLFDGLYNMLRRRYRKKMNQIYLHFTWWYLGTNDSGDAKTDNFYQSIPQWAHKTIKIGGIIVLTTLYIFIYIKNH